ncbi:hypothetical protein DPMN_183686, partial [Dreissena polymorpha]
GRPMVGHGSMHKVNRCRNEEIIVKDNFGWVWPIMGVAPQVEIDLIVIRDVQYHFEVTRCRNEEIIVKGNFGWAWPMLAGRPRIDCIVIKEVQYQFEVHQCRNEDTFGIYCFIVKGNIGWAWPMWVGAPGLVMGPCIDEIYLNRLKDNFRWVWPMWVWPILGGAPQVEIDRIVIHYAARDFCLNHRHAHDHRECDKYNLRGDSPRLKSPRFTAFPVNVSHEYLLWLRRNFENKRIYGRSEITAESLQITQVQYQLEVNPLKDNFGWVLPFMGGAPQVEIYCIVIRDVQYQFEVNLL